MERWSKKGKDEDERKMKRQKNDSNSGASMKVNDVNWEGDGWEMAFIRWTWSTRE